MTILKKYYMTLILSYIINIIGCANAKSLPVGLQFGYSIGAGINYYKATDQDISISNARHASLAWNLHISQYFNRYIGIEIGYLNYGFYENSGDDYAFCDMSGNCDYSKPGIDPPVFRSHLTVRNDIHVSSAYTTMLLRQPLINKLYLFEKIGLSYTWANIDSYVTVDPQIFNIGPTIQQYDPVGEHTHIQPFLAIGWATQITKSLALTTEFDWNGGINMFDYRGRNGRLKPMAIMVGMNYAL